MIESVERRYYAGNLTGGNGAVFEFDGLNQRIHKSYAGTVRDFSVGLDGQPFNEYQGASWQRTTGGLFTYANGETYFNRTDHLGTVRVRTDYTGATIWSDGNQPFGDGETNGPYVDFMGFAGGFWDSENNADHFGARECAKTQGRWLSPDPAGLAAVDPTNPQTWNRYAYVTNNPVSFVDPLGLFRQVPGACQGGQGICPDEGGGVDPTSLNGGGPVWIIYGWTENGDHFGQVGWINFGDFGMSGLDWWFGGGAANNKTLPKCSSLGPLGVMAASLSLASQWTGTGYTLGVNGNGLKANIVGADIAASVALVSDPAGNVGIARSLSITPSVGARSYGAGIIIGGSTFSDLSGYSSYSNVNFTTTFGAGLATGFTESSNSSGLTTTAYLGFGTGGSAGAKGLSLTNNVQAFCKQ